MSPATNAVTGIPLPPAEASDETKAALAEAEARLNEVSSRAPQAQRRLEDARRQVAAHQEVIAAAVTHDALGEQPYTAEQKEADRGTLRDLELDEADAKTALAAVLDREAALRKECFLALAACQRSAAHNLARSCDENLDTLAEAMDAAKRGWNNFQHEVRRCNDLVKLADDTAQGAGQSKAEGEFRAPQAWYPEARRALEQALKLRSGKLTVRFATALNVEKVT